ncbi:hypothetical protein P886_2305 [Alteromonadaceae bacterium 2753L.S.0a.02]|nr:hypothetical protein P886_2305 [Alteromonadaceae bacterium 2753L.S.0a.02]
MTKYTVTPELPSWDETSPDFQKETAELVTAVKELNRSVTTLNKALMRLQQRIADHSQQNANSAPEKHLH